MRESTLSISEMDFHAMKRKQLQALCKKHNIRANLSNLEMANKLDSLLKQKEKPSTRVDSRLKNADELKRGERSDNVGAKVGVTVEEIRVTTRRSLRSTEGLSKKSEGVGDDVAILGRNQAQRSSKKRKAISNDEFTAENSLAANGCFAQDGNALRRSKRNVLKVVDYALLNRNLSGKRTARAHTQAKETASVTVSGTRTGSEVEVQGKLEVVLQLEETSRRGGGKGNGRHSVMPQVEKVGTDGANLRGSVIEGESGSGTTRSLQKHLAENESAADSGTKTETEVEVQGKLEVVLQIVEPSRRLDRNGNRLSVMPQMLKVGTHGAMAQIDHKKEASRLVLECGPSHENPRENDERSRRSSGRKSFPISDLLDKTAKNIEKNKAQKRKRYPVLEEESATEVATFVEESCRGIARNAAITNIDVSAAGTDKDDGIKEFLSRSKLPNVEVDSQPYAVEDFHASDGVDCSEATSGDDEAAIKEPHIADYEVSMPEIAGITLNPIFNSSEGLPSIARKKELTAETSSLEEDQTRNEKDVDLVTIFYVSSEVAEKLDTSMRIDREEPLQDGISQVNENDTVSQSSKRRDFDSSGLVESEPEEEMTASADLCFPQATNRDCVCSFVDRLICEAKPSENFDLETLFTENVSTFKSPEDTYPGLTELRLADGASSSAAYSGDNNVAQKVESPELDENGGLRMVTLAGNSASNSVKLQNASDEQGTKIHAIDSSVDTGTENIIGGVSEDGLASHSSQRSRNSDSNALTEPHAEDLNGSDDVDFSRDTFGDDGYSPFDHTDSVAKSSDNLALVDEIEKDDKPTTCKHTQSCCAVIHQRVDNEEISLSNESRGSKENADIADVEAGEIMVLGLSDSERITPSVKERGINEAENITAINGPEFPELQTVDAASNSALSNSEKFCETTNIMGKVPIWNSSFKEQQYSMEVLDKTPGLGRSGEFDCRTPFNLEPDEEPDKVLDSTFGSDGISPVHLIDYAEGGKQHGDISVSSVTTANLVTEDDALNKITSGHCYMRTHLTPLVIAVCQSSPIGGDQVQHSTGHALSNIIDAQIQGDTDHVEVEGKSNFQHRVIGSVDSFGSVTGDKICSQHRIEEGLGDVEYNPEEVLPVERAKHTVGERTGYGILEGNSPGDGSLLPILNELNGELTMGEDNAGSETISLHSGDQTSVLVNNEIMPFSELKLLQNNVENKQESELKTLFATPVSRTNPNSKADSNGETEMEDARMTEGTVIGKMKNGMLNHGVFQELVGTTENEDAKAEINQNPLPITSEEITDKVSEGKANFEFTGMSGSTYTAFDRVTSKDSSQSLGEDNESDGLRFHDNPSTEGTTTEVLEILVGAGNSPIASKEGDSCDRSPHVKESSEENQSITESHVVGADTDCLGSQASTPRTAHCTPAYQCDWASGTSDKKISSCGLKFSVNREMQDKGTVPPFVKNYFQEDNIVTEEKVIGDMPDNSPSDATDASNFGDENARSFGSFAKKQFVGNECASEEAAYRTAGCLVSNKDLCGNETKNTAEETDEVHCSVRNSNMVDYAVGTNEYAEQHNFDQASMTKLVVNDDYDVCSSFGHAAYDGTMGDGTLELESNMFSSWEINLFSGDEVMNRISRISETHFECNDGVIANVEKDNANAVHYEEQLGKLNHLMGKEVEPKDSCLVSDEYIFERDEVSEEDMANISKDCESAEQENVDVNSFFTNNVRLTNISSIKGSAHFASVDPGIGVDFKSSARENMDDVVLEEHQRKGIVREVTELCHSVSESDSVMEDQPSEITDSAVNGGATAAEDSIVRHQKQMTTFDMKENAASMKRQNTGSIAAKATTKRRALWELQYN